MQRIAELDQPVGDHLPAEVDEGATIALRIFTPRQELPFAGHPTVGSAHAALEAGFVSQKKCLTQECGAGIIELSVEPDGRIFLRGPQPKAADGGEDPLDPARARQARGKSTSARSGWSAR